MNINKNAKRILCFGDSNTWGFVPGSLGKARFDSTSLLSLYSSISFRR